MTLLSPRPGRRFRRRLLAGISSVRGRPRRALAAAGAAVVCSLVAASPASAITFVGVNDARQLWLGSPQIPSPYISNAHRNLAAADMHRIGQARMTLRVQFRLSDLDTNGDGTIDNWTFPDAFMKVAGQTNVKVFPLFDAATTPITYTEQVAFAKGVVAVVKRYRPNSAYWNAITNIASKPSIRQAEIWNEANQSYYWNGLPEDYGSLLSHIWLQANDAGLRSDFWTITSGLAETSSNGMTPARWLVTALTEKVGRMPGGWFEGIFGIGFHPYGSSAYSVAQAKANISAFETEVRQWTRSPDTPLWLTEFGWRRSASPSYPTSFSENDIALGYAELLNWFHNTYGYRARAAFAYNLRNQGAGAQTDDGFGLLRTQGTLYANDTTQADISPPTAAWETLKTFVP